MRGDRTSHTQSGASSKKAALHGDTRHAGLPPARQIGDQNIVVQMKLRLVEDDPSAGTTAAAIERTVEMAPQSGCGACVRDARTRLGVQNAVDDLGDNTSGCREDILVGSAALRRAGHGRSEFSMQTGAALGDRCARVPD